MIAIGGEYRNVIAVVQAILVPAAIWNSKVETTDIVTRISKVMHEKLKQISQRKPHMYVHVHCINIQYIIIIMKIIRMIRIIRIIRTTTTIIIIFMLISTHILR